jgi:hypothetical protein
MEKEIINKVANSGLINLDLAEFYPKGERVVYDIKQNLWQEFVLKEKEFRKFVKENDWSVYPQLYGKKSTPRRLHRPTSNYKRLWRNSHSRFCLCKSRKFTETSGKEFDVR